MCLLDFYTTQILTSMTVSIECISWLIKVTNNDDARWKPGISHSPLGAAGCPSFGTCHASLGVWIPFLVTHNPHTM